MGSADTRFDRGRHRGERDPRRAVIEPEVELKSSLRRTPETDEPETRRMSAFEARLERLELKYLVDERTAEGVRRDIAGYCRADAHSEAARSLGESGYAITSLYLDSPGLAFHRAKERGDSDRLKLRVRTYDESSPAVLEIKRRCADVIDKSRALVPRDQVEHIASAGLVPDDLQTSDTRMAEAFAMLAARHGAEPSLRVRYLREAYVSEVDDYARITFDRRIEAQRATSWALQSGRDRWSAFDDHWQPDQRISNVVLEIKCHASVPFWVTDLIRRHRLRRCSFSKYSIGIHITDHERGFGSMMRRSAKVMM